MLNLTWSLYSLTSLCPLKDNNHSGQRQCRRIFDISAEPKCKGSKQCGLFFIHLSLICALLVLPCNYTCVTPSMNCPLAIWDISVWFRVSVQSTSEDGFHLLSLGSLILQPGTANRVRPQVYTTVQLLPKHNWYSRCWLTSALVLGPRPTLRCTSGGFSPVSRGKVHGNFPVSSYKGHSLSFCVSSEVLHESKLHRLPEGSLKTFKKLNALKSLL